MIIDTHHHLWKFNMQDYGWMDDSMAVLKRDYLPGDLEKQLAPAGVGGTVVVQARQTIEETRWLLELADKNDFIKGVVGWVDLRTVKLDEQLEKFGNHPKLAGVRHVIHDEPDDDFMLGKDFLKGIAKLQKFDLTYDLLLFPKHLPGAIKLAGMFPDQRFVLDHISKPLIKQGILDPWQDDITALAQLPNVWCKVSGMVTEADLNSWKKEDFAPYIDVVLKAFGPGRLMLGSDWPVCRLAGEYNDIIKIPVDFLKNIDINNKEAIFSRNAMDCYKLENFNYGEEKV